MSKVATSKRKIKEITSLRKKGFSVKQIAEMVSIGVGTSSKYCKLVPVSKNGLQKLEQRRFPSKLKSLEQIQKAKEIADDVIGKKISARDIILIAAALYWGEGTKRELNLINSDPDLIKVFLRGLIELGVAVSSVKINIRYYSNQDKEKIKTFWLSYLGLEELNVTGYEIVESSSENKLQYGMCRIRVTKSSLLHKTIQSLILKITSGSSIG